MTRDIFSGVLVEILLFGASVAVPIAGSLCSIFMPLPVLFYRVKLGRRAGAAIPAITLVILALVIGGPSLHLLGFVELLLIGFILGELLEQRQPVDRIVLSTCLVVFATGAVGAFFLSALAGSGLIAGLNAYVADNIRLTLDLYREMGIPAEDVQLVGDKLESIQAVIVSIVPALTIGSTLLITWINLLAARVLLTRRGLLRVDFGSLNRWRTPDFLVWAVIAAAVLTLLPGRIGFRIGLNGLLILAPLYFFQGMAIIAFYFEKTGIPRALRVFLYGVVFLQHVLLAAVIGLGFFDVWLNLRRLGNKPA